MKSKLTLTFALIILSLSLGIPQVQAQERWMDKGDELFSQGSYLDAIEFFRWSYKKDDNPFAIVRIGDCFRKLNKYEEAREWYAKAGEFGISDPEYWLHYTQTLMATGYYDEALDPLSQYENLKPDDTRISGIRQVINRHSEILHDSSHYLVDKAPFNSNEADLCPIPFGDGLIFSSSRKSGWGVVHTGEGDSSPLLDMFWLEKIPLPDEKLKRKDFPGLLKGEVNTRFHDGPASLSPEGDILYFTRNNFFEGKVSTSVDRVNKLKIFQAELVDGKWINVAPLHFTNDDYAFGHPAVSPDGKWLYFVSDMPGGYGGTDIFRVEIQGSNFGEPENLGPIVNSIGDEMFPYIFKDGSLYFSSGGHAGLGGLDIFELASLPDGSQQLRRMASPLNSPGDDFGLFFTDDKKLGYFSSNRGPGVVDNIYSFITQRPDFECKPQEDNQYCFTFFESSAIERAEGEPLIFEWDFGDGTKARGAEIYHCYEKTGAYFIQLNVVDSITGEVFFNFATYDFDLEDIHQTYITAPEWEQQGQLVAMNAHRSTPTGIKTEEYFWDFGDGGTGEGEEVVHVYNAPGEYEIQLGLVGKDPSTWQETSRCVTRNITIYPEGERPAPAECTPQQENQYCFDFSESVLPDHKGLPVRYEWNFGDGSRAEGLEAKHCFGAAGTYKVRLNLIDKNSGKIMFNQASYKFEVSNIVQPIVKGPKILHAGESGTFNGKPSRVKNCLIDSYQWEIEGQEAREGELVTLAFNKWGEQELRLRVKGKNPATGFDCEACVTSKMDILRDGDEATDLKLNEQGTNEIKENPKASEVAEVEYNAKEHKKQHYAVQVAEAQEHISTDSSYFRGLENVKEWHEGDHYTYTVGDEKNLKDIYPLYQEVEKKGFEATMVIAHEDGVLLSGHDTTFYVKIPGLDVPSTMSVVKGLLKDVDGNPVSAEIIWEDITQSKIYSTTSTDEKGQYYIELPNGSLYSFHADKPGMFPVSDFIDLRGIEKTKVYEGKMEVIPVEDLGRKETTIRINNIFFDSGKATLKSESYNELDRLARIIIENPGLKVVVEGHTDAINDDLTNLKLSQARAKSVLRYMVLQGFSIDNISSKGYGESRPIADNRTTEGRRKNRRVEFRFLKLEEN